MSVCQPSTFNLAVYIQFFTLCCEFINNKLVYGTLFAIKKAKSNSVNLNFMKEQSDEGQHCLYAIKIILQKFYMSWDRVFISMHSNF